MSNEGCNAGLRGIAVEVLLFLETMHSRIISLGCGYNTCVQYLSVSLRHRVALLFDERCNLRSRLRPIWRILSW